MNNPLSLEEKIHTIRLIGHDFTNHVHTLFHAAAKHTKISEDDAYHLQGHLCDVAASVTILGLYEGNIFPDEITDTNVSHKLRQLVSNFDNSIAKKIDCSVPFCGYFNSKLPLLYMALYNLVKNSSKVITARKGKIRVSVSKHLGIANSLVYACPETPLEGEFIKFNVWDNGRGFPKNKPLEDYLKLGISSRKDGGFGLYYVTLVCKFLRCHLSIESEPGNTNVAIYHPLNLE